MSAVVRRKRVYDRPAAGDGVRVLVERLWPRGVSKDAAAIDLWLKAIAPSDGLRRWYAHDAERFDEFRNRYCDELDHNREAVDGLLELAARSLNPDQAHALAAERFASLQIHAPPS